MVPLILKSATRARKAVPPFIDRGIFLLVKPVVTGIAHSHQLKEKLSANVSITEMVNLRWSHLPTPFADTMGTL